MKARALVLVLFAVLSISQPVSLNAFTQSDVLASWNDAAVRSAIIDFVSRVTKEISGEVIARGQEEKGHDNR
jgi:hypothetical protein